MAQVIPLRCRHGGKPMTNNRRPYCSPCILKLCYQAMPILLGILMTDQIALSPARSPMAIPFNKKQSAREPYEHSREVMD